MDGGPSEARGGKIGQEAHKKAGSSVLHPSLAVNGLEIFFHADDNPIFLFCHFQKRRAMVDEFPRIIMVDDKGHVAVRGGGGEIEHPGVA